MFTRFCFKSSFGISSVVLQIRAFQQKAIHFITTFDIIPAAVKVGLTLSRSSELGGLVLRASQALILQVVKICFRFGGDTSSQAGHVPGAFFLSLVATRFIVKR
jgi:hypothetical protein